MSALGDRGITLEGLAAAVDALRQELATWKALAHKQDQLSADQITATQSGATAAKISQIAVNTAAIQSLAAQVAGQISLAYVTTLPATGEPLTLYLVPQGDGTAPNFCDEYLWINDAWELIGTTGAMANNGELTIQVNGVAVGTFTANQATNAAVNITVPTNTSQLVNGAGYVDTAALQAALALKQNSLNAAQLEAVNSGITAALVTQIGTNATAIAGKQDALTAAQQAAVDSGATAAKIDQIASNASAIVSLTSSKQDSLSTTQLAAVNSGVTSAAVQQIGTNADNISALGTAVASKAADADVVHLAGAETITGDKTFTGAVVTHNITPETDGTYALGTSTYRWLSVYSTTNYFINRPILTFGTPPSASDYFGYRYNDNKGAVFGDLLFCAHKDGQNYLRMRCRNTDGTNTYDREMRLQVNRNGTTWVIPNTSNTIDLGTSSNKWKTLNGINPGSLGMPAAGSARVDISSVITDLTGADITFNPPVSGWLFLRIDGAVGNMLYVQQSSYGLINRVDGNGTDYIYLNFPFQANVNLTIKVKGTSGLLARYYPCLGNV